MDKKVYAILLKKIRETGGDTYSKAEIDEMISQLHQFETEYVERLPVTNIKPNCIYFVPRTSGTGNDMCYEYMYINDKWEFVGSTEVDLTNYWTIDEVKQYVDDNTYVLPAATEDTLGGVKLSKNGSIGMDTEGNMNIATVSNDDIEALFQSA